MTSYRTVNHKEEAPRVTGPLSAAYIGIAKAAPFEIPEIGIWGAFPLIVSFSWTGKLEYIKLKDELSRSIALLLIAETLMDKGL